ncbi:MAG: hypothetical protein J0H01_31605 [Rhizobiales bacterium]|nr:hypothetical protein [Hyphomicrobiales bacterium]
MAMMTMARRNPVRMPVARMAVRLGGRALHLDGVTSGRGLGDRGRRDRCNRLGAQRTGFGGLAAGDGCDGDATDQGCEESATIQHGNLLGVTWSDDPTDTQNEPANLNCRYRRI